MSRKEVKSILELKKKTQYSRWKRGKNRKKLTHQGMVTNCWQEILFNVFLLFKSFKKKWFNIASVKKYMRLSWGLSIEDKKKISFVIAQYLKKIILLRFPASTLFFFAGLRIKRVSLFKKLDRQRDLITLQFFSNLSKTFICFPGIERLFSMRWQYFGKCSFLIKNLLNWELSHRIFFLPL